MKVLTRNSLSSGEFLDGLELPADVAWTREQITQSLAETLKSRPPGQLWVFGYGSLMWNPLLLFEEKQPAVLYGWHRSFCIRMTSGRATLSNPGRMLALEPGGYTSGVALRLADSVVDDELGVLWMREMVTGAYRPTWLPIVFQDGQEVLALTFVANETRPHYERDSSVATIAPLVAAASGEFGSNVDYVTKLEIALSDGHVPDKYVDALVTAVKLAQI